jgi:hypothetical protein
MLMVAVGNKSEMRVQESAQAGSRSWPNLFRHALLFKVISTQHQNMQHISIHT